MQTPTKEVGSEEKQLHLQIAEVIDRALIQFIIVFRTRGFTLFFV